MKMNFKTAVQKADATPPRGAIFVPVCGNQT